MSKQQVSEETPAVDEAAQAGAVVDTPVEETSAPTIEDLVADPTTEELAASAETIEPAAGETAAAITEVTPTDDAGGVAAGEELEQEPSIEPPHQREDGKWVHGKYVAATLEDLFVQVEKGRLNAEKLVGKRKEELAAETDPFMYPDEEFDENIEIIDDEDFGAQIGAGVAQALAQAGLMPQAGQDPQALVQAQALGIAQQAIDSPRTTDDEFRAVLAALIQANPMDHQSRQVVLDEWGARNPVVAAQEASRIEIAFAQHNQSLQQQQAQFEAQQQYEAEQQTLTLEQVAKQEFVYGQTTFVQQHPDWQQRNDGMNEWLRENAWLMDQAKQAPVQDPQNPRHRPRAEAVFRVLKMAYDASGAGIGGGVSEHGTTMGSVTDPNNISDAHRELAAEQRGLAGLETGAAIDDVTINVANSNPPGLANASFEDLVGIPTVS